MSEEIKKEELKVEDQKQEETKEEKKPFSVDTLIGMVKDAAIDLAKKAGFKTRILEENGESFMGTMDVREDRVNLTIKNNTVEKAKVG